MSNAPLDQEPSVGITPRTENIGAVLHALIRKLEQLHKLSHDDIAAIAATVTRVEEYRPNEDIIAQGDTPTEVHLIVDGYAARYKLVPSGSRQIMAFLIPGDLCDIQLTVLQHMDHSISALSPCTVAHLDMRAVARLIEDNKAVARAFWWSVLVDEAIVREWMVNIGRRSAERRLAHILCELLQRMRAVGLTNGDSFVLPLTQQHLADATGLSAVHLNRMMQALRATGLITTDGKKVAIHDIRGLIKEAEFEADYLHQERGQMRYP